MNQTKEIRKQNCGPLGWIVLRTWFQRYFKGVSDWLQQKAGGLSKRQLTVMLICFCGLASGVSTWVLLQSLQESPGQVIPLQPIRVLPLRPQNVPRAVLTQKEWQQLLQLRRYQDSLTSVSGRKEMSSLVTKQK